MFCVAYAFVMEQVLGDATLEASTFTRAFVTLGLAGAAHVPTLNHLFEAAPVVAPLLVSGVRRPSRLRSAPPTMRAHDDPPMGLPS